MGDGRPCKGAPGQARPKRQETVLCLALAVVLTLGPGMAKWGVNMAMPVLDDDLGSSVEAAEPQGTAIRLFIDGKVIAATVGGRTVGDALAELGILLRPKDRVSCDLTAPVKEGMEIKIARIREEVVTRQVETPYAVERRYDKMLDQGRTRVVRRGVPGLVEERVCIVYEDGRPVRETVLSKKEIRPPVSEIVVIGTRKPLRTLVTSRGTYRYRNKYTMVATAYEPGPKSCGIHADGYTAIGLRATKGIAAVDPAVIPLRSRLYVTGYGHAIAGDVGSAIKGFKIDLCFDTVEEALRFGRRRVEVYVLEP